MKTWNVALLAACGLSTVGTVGTFGCASEPPSKGADDVEVVRSAQERDTQPTLSESELGTLAKGQADFAVDIFHAVTKMPDSANEDVFLSPHSISIALGMTYAGARGETAAEMKKALHLGLPDDRVHTGFNYLDLELASRGKTASGKDGKPFRLNVTSSFWGQKGASFEAPFLDTLAVSYGAGLNVVDFVGETEPSRVAINGWVEQKTEDRIKDLIPSGMITSSTRAVLVNAVYFNAAWAHKFIPESTAPAPFTKLDGTAVEVATMHEQESYPFAAGDGYEAIALPYDGDELSLLVIAPTAGTYATFESSLTGGKVLDILAGLSTKTVNLSFPKLKLEASFALRQPLGSLGMTKAFADADFSGISTTMSLAIDEVVHKTFLAIDENGTEAAAATAVVMRDTSAPIDVVTMKVDRPFLTAIVDRKTKALVFFGRILEPKG